MPFGMMQGHQVSPSAVSRFSGNNLYQSPNRPTTTFQGTPGNPMLKGGGGSPDLAAQMAARQGMGLQRGWGQSMEDYKTQLAGAGMGGSPYTGPLQNLAVDRDITGGAPGSPITQPGGMGAQAQQPQLAPTPVSGMMAQAPPPSSYQPRRDGYAGGQPSQQQLAQGSANLTNQRQQHIAQQVAQMRQRSGYGQAPPNPMQQARQNFLDQRQGAWQADGQQGVQGLHQNMMQQIAQQRPGYGMTPDQIDAHNQQNRTNRASGRNWVDAMRESRLARGVKITPEMQQQQRADRLSGDWSSSFGGGAAELQRAYNPNMLDHTPEQGAAIQANRQALIAQGQDPDDVTGGGLFPDYQKELRPEFNRSNLGPGANLERQRRHDLAQQQMQQYNQYHAGAADRNAANRARNEGQYNNWFQQNNITPAMSYGDSVNQQMYQYGGRPPQQHPFNNPAQQPGPIQNTLFGTNYGNRAAGTGLPQFSQKNFRNSSNPWNSARIQTNAFGG